MCFTAKTNPQGADRQPGAAGVAVLVETDDNWGRSVVRGIADYAHGHTHWQLLIDPRGQRRRPALPDGWSGGGVIARIGSQTLASQLRDLPVPAVNVDTLFEGLPGVGDVTADDAEAARLALAHLRTHGFRRFACFAPPTKGRSLRRAMGFVDAVKRAGLECSVYKPPRGLRRSVTWAEKQQRVAHWLDSLAKPVAAFAVNARRARQLAEFCSAANLRVPDEVAILAGDSDELFCELGTPTLSSIAPTAERIGYEAAALLDRMMQGAPPPPVPIRIAPGCVECRLSTDVLAIDDDAVVRALRFIQRHAFGDIAVQDILDEVNISRRTLEIQFRNCLGRSPSEEIRRIRLDRGRELLGRSALPIAEIATRCGFSNATRFGVAFKKRFGQTPMGYRKHLNKTPS